MVVYTQQEHPWQRSTKIRMLSRRGENDGMARVVGEIRDASSTFLWWGDSKSAQKQYQGVDKVPALHTAESDESCRGGVPGRYGATSGLRARPEDTADAVNAFTTALAVGFKNVHAM